MDALKGSSAECIYCNISGYGKGTDDYGHIHCRMCTQSKYQRRRSEPAKDEVWEVHCTTAQTMVKVKSVILKNRSQPPSFSAGHGIFRTPCRMIHITLGKDSNSKTFVVHEPLLVTSSAYFQGALKSTFKEGQNCQVDLPEEDPLVFGLLNEYLYRASVEILTPTTSEPHDWKNLLVCFGELWLLSHYLQMPKLVNYSMWRIVLWMDETYKSMISPATSIPPSVGVDDIYDLYDNAPMDSKLRKFLVDLFVWSGWKLMLGEEAPHLMLREMVDELRRKCEGKVKNPLLDVGNYYVKEGELVSVEEEKAEAA